MFSVVILTLNEEHNLPACLASVRESNDVVVLDSGSTDRTSEIARATGARVVVNPFVDFAAQRNFAHTQISFKHPWVFHLDADEQMMPELVKECAKCAQADNSAIDGFFVAPRMIFLGRWIPRCTDFPTYQARFVHALRFRFVQSGHGQREAPEMRMATLRGNYLHDLSSGGEAEMESKHQGYARQEAAAFLARSAYDHSVIRRLLSGHALTRRRALKEGSHHLPARGLLRFVYQYGWRRGFLDGSAGYRYCRVLARYEAAIAREIRLLKRSSPRP